MNPLDTLGMVSLLGLFAQCAVAWIFAVFFVVLSRTAGRPAWFTQWTLSFVALALALSAMSIRYGWLLYVPGTAFLVESAPEVRVAYAVYAAGKALHVALLCTGTLQFAGGALPASARRTLYVASALLAAALALASSDLRAVMLVQSPVMAVGLALACALFVRLPEERRDVGTRTAALALAVSAVLWALYAAAFVFDDGVLWPLRRDVWAGLLNFNSYLDLAVMVALAAGLSAALQLDARRRLRLLQAERESLADELARDGKLRALGTLVSGVAHELSTPLATVLAAAEDLRSAERSRVRRERLDELLEEARRANEIVETMTGLRQGGRGEGSSVSAGALAARVMVAAREEVERRGVTLELDGALEAELVVDERAVERALAALVDNALHVTPRGGRVQVEVLRDGTVTVFKVRDEGPGVPAELQARIFEPFFTTRPDEGHLGLGLSVAHATARTHEGSLTIEPEGGGTCFVLALPRDQKAAPVEPALPAEPRSPDSPLHLLVVDDEPMLREVLTKFGRRQGWLVQCAADGAEALELLNDAPQAPDCVLCDLRMPTMSGQELYEQVLATDPSLAERFVFQTGDVSSGEAQEMAATTGLEVLEKPLSFTHLRAWIEASAARRPAGTPQ